MEKAADRLKVLDKIKEYEKAEKWDEDVDDVENVLSYESLKSAWNKIKRQIKILIEN